MILARVALVAVLSRGLKKGVVARMWIRAKRHADPAPTMTTSKS